MLSCENGNRERKDWLAILRLLWRLPLDQHVCFLTLRLNERRQVISLGAAFSSLPLISYTYGLIRSQYPTVDVAGKECLQLFLLLLCLVQRLISMLGKTSSLREITYVSSSLVPKNISSSVRKFYKLESSKLLLYPFSADQQFE